ncbi:MAG: peptide-methionine (S)-S-oxide reductase MsrA [Bdellovibrionia bacterium]
MQKETIFLAGGCFWGMEDLLRNLKGVTHTEVGYMGGQIKNATYNLVKLGSTGHAETVKIEYDANTLKTEELLKFFFKIHDPTTLNQQGNDIGTQYRSAIFYTTEAQKEAAKNVMSLVEKSGAWKKPLVTTLDKATEFWTAEDYHQDYLVKNPNGYTCHYIRKVEF